MKIIRNIRHMQRSSRAWRRRDLVIGLGPTMGCLHRGHLSLIEIAKKKADITVVSIFVNPTQFSPSEDFGAYPRNFARDRKICADSGVTAIFSPRADEVYPPGFSTSVTEELLSKPLCGKSRPIHFQGVTTIVCKLFLAVLPDFAVFGQKDAQQALVIKKMTTDLNFPIDIVVGPIIREVDGLAMSSRNRYLSPERRKSALAIYRGIELCQEIFDNGERDSGRIKKIVTNEIETHGGRIDYVECVSIESLESIEKIKGSALVAVAAYFGDTRLIDNRVLEE
jgi:pantoate--beta-alanine ligase